jgi:hypothetical protein
MCSLKGIMAGLKKRVAQGSKKIRQELSGWDREKSGQKGVRG